MATAVDRLLVAAAPWPLCEAAGVRAEEHARGWDCRIVRDGPAEFDGYHWRPSRRFRLAVVQRARAADEHAAAVAAAT